MLGFVRWAFKDAYKNVQFWAFSLVMLSIVAQLGGCPDPVPWYTAMVGLAVSLIDSTIWFVKVQYEFYNKEKNQISRELSRK